VMAYLVSFWAAAAQITPAQWILIGLVVFLVAMLVVYYFEDYWLAIEDALEGHGLGRELDASPRLDQWLGAWTGNEAQPQPGQVLIAVRERRPYASSPSVSLLPVCGINPRKLRSASSELTAEKIASTSALVGFTSRLSAMARAVRSRSYAAIATSTSRLGARLRCIASSLRSKLSIMGNTSSSSRANGSEPVSAHKEGLEP
jgi:hypothetical protein